MRAFDQPIVDAPTQRYEDKPKAPLTKEPTEMSMVPMFSPQFVGGSFAAKF